MDFLIRYLHLKEMIMMVDAVKYKVVCYISSLNVYKYYHYII